MKIYTVSFAGVESGAALSKFSPVEGVEIWAVLVGEEGRGRKLGVLPYKGSVDPAKPVALAAAIGTSRTGRPVLIPDTENHSGDAIVVARVTYGFRGSGRLVGRFLGWAIEQNSQNYGPELYPTEVSAREAAVASGKYWWHTVRPQFEDYHPRVIVDGVVADGLAGNMASATQVVFVCKAGEQFCLYRTGRLYGGEPFVQFRNNAGVIQQVTEWDEL